MSRAHWIDISSRSCNDSDSEPTAWELTDSPFRVVITRHLDYPGAWVMTEHDMCFDKRVLKSVDVEEAKREAIVLVLTRFRSWAKAFE